MGIFKSLFTQIPIHEWGKYHKDILTGSTRRRKICNENEQVLSKITMNQQIIFKYVNEQGEEAGYPWNPNGSLQNIAGICDSTGQVLGMMPHPERYIEQTQHPHWTRAGLTENGGGFFLFKNAVNYVKSAFS